MIRKGQPMHGNIDFGRQKVQAVRSTFHHGKGREDHAVTLTIYVKATGISLSVEPDDLDEFIEDLIAAREWLKAPNEGNER